MKNLLRLTLGLWLSGAFALCGQTEFTSLHVFGDGITTTTNGPGGTYYHGKRFTNGRVWVEVLAQRQGLEFSNTNNWSYFGHYSPNLVANINNFDAPPDVNTALFVIWVNNADFVENLANPSFAPYNDSNLAIWNAALNQSLTNHFEAVEMLYDKGVRTLVMPNTVDVTKVPYYVHLDAVSKSFVRQRVMDYNTLFADTWTQTMASRPGLTIYVPDFFALLDDVVTHPANYGMVNAQFDGQSIDALSDPTLTDKSLDGPGGNYIFWDYLDPTAKAHEIIADATQQLISPMRISQLTQVDGNNRLELVNLPVGLEGFVEGGNNFEDWNTEAAIAGTNAVQTVLFPVAGSFTFFRLRFPYAWNWP